mgnify:CR=1 FL=1
MTIKKQQLNSQKTKKEIMQAASSLFISNGYEETSINEIVEKAGCSVGAFYGHFKSKQELVTRIWLDETINTIKLSVEKGSRITDHVIFVDYLIERSNVAAQNQITNKLYRFCYLTTENSSELSMYTSRYLSMIRNMLYSYAPNASEDTLWTYASIIHSLLNAHSQKNSNQMVYFHFSDEIMRHAIIQLMEVCRTNYSVKTDFDS